MRYASYLALGALEDQLIVRRLENLTSLQQLISTPVASMAAMPAPKPVQPPIDFDKHLPHYARGGGKKAEIDRDAYLGFLTAFFINTSQNPLNPGVINVKGFPKSYAGSTKGSGGATIKSRAKAGKVSEQARAREGVNGVSV